MGCASREGLAGDRVTTDTVNATDTSGQGLEDLIVEAMTGQAKPVTVGGSQAREARAPFSGLGLALLALGVVGSRLGQPSGP